jgi:hypothetical protein
MLAEVIGSEEFFCVVALPEFMHFHQMLDSRLPIMLYGGFSVHAVLTYRSPHEFLATIATGICFSRARR